MFYFTRGEQIVIALCLVVLLAAGGLWVYMAGVRNGAEEGEEIFTPAPLPVAPPEEPDILVHVCGQVRRPGVYRVKPHNRVLEVIKFAGGATEDGDLHVLNLAAYVRDGDRIYVPTKEEAQGALVAAALAARRESSTPAPSAISSSSRAPSSSALLPKGKINLNKATAAQLETLPGIGPVLAQRIIAYRGQQGWFRRPEDLLNVSGIGPKTFANLKEYVTVE